MGKRTDQEEFYYHARIDREAQKLLDKIKREVEAENAPLIQSWSDALIFGVLAGLSVVAALISVAGCLQSILR